ncbi:PQQ-binding-like beta-propeller repeat protein, partial [Candidatus Sumerlaeota bacterium]|nr:PQQ-binding-like beta-propeller repeat protein [Candidatus Sumerlaeota bacterium]
MKRNVRLAVSPLAVFVALLPAISLCVALAPVQAAEPAPGDWPSYSRDAGGSNFSPLARIDKTNVAQLRRAWTYHTGDVFLDEERIGRNVFECTPLVVEGKLFILTPFSRVVALDPATGAELWTFDPELDTARAGDVLASRGLAYWTKGDRSRILVPVRDGRVISLIAETGRPDPAFGDAGTVDLRSLFGPERPRLFLSSPPALYRDLFHQG